MRILVLLTDAFGGHGGIAKFNRDLLTALCAYPGKTEVVALPRLILSKPESLPAGLTYVTGAAGAKWRFPLALLRTLFRREPFDLVICAHLNLLPLAALARFWTKAPLVQMIHGIEAWQPPVNRWRCKFVRRIDALVAVSDFTRERFKAWSGYGDKPSFILPNCVDLSQFSPGPKSPGLLKRYGLEGRTVMLTVARLSASERYKGIDEVLEVLPRLITEVPGLAYLVVGDGTDRARLVGKARSLGLSVTEIEKPPSSAHPASFAAQPSTFNSQPPQVVFAGHVPESEKADHYRLADAFVMPGWGEGFGIVYLEAMACGVPVVASKLDASQEAVQGGKLGNLVNPRVPEEIVSGTLIALRSPKGVPAGLDHFSQAHFQRRVFAFVRELATRWKLVES